MTRLVRRSRSSPVWFVELFLCGSRLRGSRARIDRYSYRPPNQSTVGTGPASTRCVSCSTGCSGFPDIAYHFHVLVRNSFHTRYLTDHKAFHRDESSYYTGYELVEVVADFPRCRAECDATPNAPISFTAGIQGLPDSYYVAIPCQRLRKR